MSITGRSKPDWVGRLRVLSARESDDFSLRSRAGQVLWLVSVALVPCVIAFCRPVDRYPDGSYDVDHVMRASFPIYFGVVVTLIP